MDTVQVVNNYMQSGDMGIFQFWQGLTNFFIVLFAGMMWWNARAHLKNATAMKELEKTNLKIAIWPEIKEIINAVDKYTLHICEWNLNNTQALQDIFDYMNVMQFAHYYFQEDDELLTHLKQLITIGGDIRVLYLQPKPKIDSVEHSKWIAKIEKQTKSLLDKSKVIRELLQNRTNLAISSKVAMN